jgi:hypothetical protein
VLLATSFEHSSAPANAQSPFPTGLMTMILPGDPVPPENADVLVVYGLGAGVGGPGCNPTLASIVSETVARINAHEPVVTQISVQSGCSSNTQDWKDMLDALVAGVLFYTDDADSGFYWGGVMLDEEFDWWTVSAFLEINNHVQGLMEDTPGLSWWFTENFTAPGYWSQADFNSLTGTSTPAPQIATEHMVNLTNDLPSAAGNVLVTWSIGYPNAEFASLYRATSRINAGPYYQWGGHLSNCFRHDSDP